MKKVILPLILFALLNTSCADGRAEVEPVNIQSEAEIKLESPLNTVEKSDRKVQVALLLDTSNSMDGLIDQAKSRLWNIINTLSTLRFEGKSPIIEIALYEYGNDGIEEADGYVRKVISLSTDLDEISNQLFQLRTNGGSEFCGTVISKSLNQLAWSDSDKDIKLIYIAGNEEFNQGNIAYQETCANAVKNDIFVNTIFCGNYDKGITQFWQNGAVLGKGKFFNINTDKKIQFISTPYDERINKCNSQLNKTYLGYGGSGKAKMKMQREQDFNAEAMSSSNMVERCISKSSATYANASWDIVDKFDADSTAISKLSEDELPTELKEKTKEEQLEVVRALKAERELIKDNIAKLAKKRQEFINTATKNTKDSDDFGKAINLSVKEIARKKGFVFEKE